MSLLFLISGCIIVFFFSQTYGFFGGGGGWFQGLFLEVAAVTHQIEGPFFCFFLINFATGGWGINCS